VNGKKQGQKKNHSNKNFFNWKKEERERREKKECEEGFQYQSDYHKHLQSSGTSEKGGGRIEKRGMTAAATKKNNNLLSSLAQINADSTRNIKNIKKKKFEAKKD
jgi:hypothetical protein